MPAEGIHLTALREAMFVGSLAAPARRCVLRHESAARLGAVAPDLPYFDRYGEALVRYVVRRPARSSPWGARVHQGGAIDLALTVLAHARRQRSDRLAAVALGLVSHACIDRSIHPLVNALARRFPEAASHDDSHREVEKFQSILFHERYLGADRMGTAGLERLVAVPASELLAEPQVAAALHEAFARATSDVDVVAPLRRMARGYVQHAIVLGSRLGKRVAPPAEKARARPLFFEGPWGSFERVLEEAVVLSVPVLEATWAAFEASESEAERANAALSARLPAGSIEGQGRDIDLDRPFVTRPPSEIAS